MYTFKREKNKKQREIHVERHYRGHLNAALADSVRAEETDTERSVISRGNVCGNSFVRVTHEKLKTILIPSLSSLRINWVK